MGQYIDKDAVLAEIDKRIKVLQKHPMENHKTICHLDSVKQSVNSLEVKEVDLDGISRHYALNNSPWDDCMDEIQDAYKAGFELGIKVQKEE